MILNGGKYICSANRDRGACANGKIIAATSAERHVLGGVKTHLISPEAIALAVARYQEAADEHRRMIERERAPMEKELAEIAWRRWSAPWIAATAKRRWRRGLFAS